MMPAFDTEWPADTVEFCPHPSAADILLCGTYKLEEPQSTLLADGDSPSPSTTSSQHRKGKCLVLRINSSETKEPTVELLQSVELPAVPDIKWCPLLEDVNPVVAVANSEGAITLHEWQIAECSLKIVSHVQLASSSTLCLSLDWANRRVRGTTPGSLVVSLSDGHLTVLQPGEDVILQQVQTWQAHDYEPWIAAWDCWNPNIIYSGGDDLTLKGWDIRQHDSKPIFTNRRFQAGVTTIQSHPYVEFLLAVGSYDNNVRLFDVRSPLKPLTEINVGGGVWRTKWHPSESRKRDLLVACMHDGFKVVRFGDDMTSGDAIKRFDEHASIAYGVDWSFKEGVSGDTLISSCSFYDHTLHLWRG